MQTTSIENIFARAWTLLVSNPVIVVPGIVVGALAGIVQTLVFPHPVVHGDPTSALVGLGGALVGGAIALGLSVLAFVITQTYTTGMAGAAWERGRTTLADGGAAFREDAGRLLAAMLVIAVIGTVATVLTFGIGWYIVLFFAIYMIPAVVLDNRGAFPALRLSANIATKRVVSTIIIVVMLFAIGVVVALVVLPLAFIPFLGSIVTAIVSQTVTAYATLVIVGEYLSVRGAPDVASARC